MKSKNYFARRKSFVFAMMALIFCGQAQSQLIQYAPGHPPMISGVAIEPLEKHQVPDFLKSQARQEIQQMKAQGFVHASEEAVDYLDRAKADTGKFLRPWNEIRPRLKIIPATVRGTPLEASGVKVLGGIPGGISSAEGWTAITRLLLEPKLGLMMLDETDYVASGGGLLMIEEAINQEVNGRPAILRIKTSPKGKSITELTWATDQKIYTLSANRSVKGDTLQAMLDFAKNLHD